MAGATERKMDIRQVPYKSGDPDKTPANEPAGKMPTKTSRSGEKGGGNRATNSSHNRWK